MYATITRMSSSNSSKMQPTKPFKCRFFECYVIISTILIWSVYTLLLRHSRTKQDNKPMYFPTTVVLLSEFIKFWIAVILLLHSHNYSCRSSVEEIRNNILRKPLDLLKMSVPSIAYAIQNNLDFIALSNLDPGVYQVTCQMKIVTTAICMMIMLGKEYSMVKWIAILLLCTGAALVQLDSITTPSSTSMNTEQIINQTSQNYWIGLTAVLATCVTSGFAGVYFERMLKDAKASLWIRNLQMYFCGIITALMACAFQDGSYIRNHGFFYGYDYMVWSIVGLLSLGGIYISLVIKYLDNILKSFASSVTIVVVSVISVNIFDTSLGVYFIIGSLTVSCAVILYGSYD